MFSICMGRIKCSWRRKLRSWKRRVEEDDTKDEEEVRVGGQANKHDYDNDFSSAIAVITVTASAS